MNRRQVLAGVGTAGAVGVGLTGVVSASGVDGKPVFCGCSQICVCLGGRADVLMGIERDDGSFEVGFVVGDGELDPYPDGEPRYSGNVCVSTDDAGVPTGRSSVCRSRTRGGSTPISVPERPSTRNSDNSTQSTRVRRARVAVPAASRRASTPVEAAADRNPATTGTNGGTAIPATGTLAVATAEGIPATETVGGGDTGRLSSADTSCSRSSRPASND
ncbi:hypothetical protein GJ629_03330 [Halapricum sp. CBA1109]|uniref:hypothetical protein n=1 Tax=Halapricum sp. CBA1109 TaxID=2668068 RepID=UPI0012F8EE51|nr:hypothetical protein [Halapricum sp. CBA1109]MUV89048.1 hypothetical protein [Halapricum sp. CBA1109]